MEKYWYCTVGIENIDSVYMYISDQGEIPTGAYVEVLFGRNNDLVVGSVLHCELFEAANAPFPVERTKHILRVLTSEERKALEQEKTDEQGPDAEEEIAEAQAYMEDEDWDALFQWALQHHEDTRPEIIAVVIRSYELCAKQNMPLAALNLGTFYYNGVFVPRDYKKAFALYKIAADAGELRAICNCGYCFYYGRHQEVDYTQALRYFTLGALLHEDANCLYKIGDMYLNGYGVEQNAVYAFKLYQHALEACEHDSYCYADCLERVGRCLLKGIGIAKDFENAHICLSNALHGFYTRRRTDPFAAGRIYQDSIFDTMCFFRICAPMPVKRLIFWAFATSDRRNPACESAPICCCCRCAHSGCASFPKPLIGNP